MVTASQNPDDVIGSLTDDSLLFTKHENTLTAEFAQDGVVKKTPKAINWEGYFKVDRSDLQPTAWEITDTYPIERMADNGNKIIIGMGVKARRPL